MSFTYEFTYTTGLFEAFFVKPCELTNSQRPLILKGVLTILNLH
jgi:hypothetical protein